MSTKQICPFDKSHILQTVEQLKKHITTCKSPNKFDFQQCRHNPQHWINFSKIKQHQQDQCPTLKQKLNKSQISMSNDSVLHQLYQQLDDPRLNLLNLEIQSMIKQQEQRSMQLMKKNKNKNKKKIIQQESRKDKIKLWEQPQFKGWIIRNKPVLHYDKDLGIGMSNFSLDDIEDD